MLDAVKVKLNPTIDQTQVFLQHVGCCRKIYNELLTKQINTYKKEKTFLFDSALVEEMNRIIIELPYLLNCIGDSLEQSRRNLETAFKNFFKSKQGQRKGIRVGFPKFKSKRRSKESFTISQRKDNIICFKNYVKIRNIGWIKVYSGLKCLSSVSNEEIKRITVSKDSDGCWYCSILVDRQYPITKDILFTGDTVGIDLGITNTITLPNAVVIKIPETLFGLEKKIKKLNKQLHSKILGSKNREKIRQRLGRIYFRMKKIRETFCHRLSFKLVKHFDIITVETLSIQKMMNNRNLSRLISNSSWYRLISYLRYKCERYGKILIEVSKQFPSSKLCSCCGYKNKNLKLNDRSWTCPKCNVLHNRDVNASQNLNNISQWFKRTGERITTEGRYLQTIASETGVVYK